MTTEIFFDSHGDTWIIVPGDHPDAVNFGPSAWAVPVHGPTYAEARALGRVESADGWDWLRPAFAPPPRAVQVVAGPPPAESYREAHVWAFPERQLWGVALCDAVEAHLLAGGSVVTTDELPALRAARMQRAALSDDLGLRVIGPAGEAPIEGPRGQLGFFSREGCGYDLLFFQRYDEEGC